MKSFYLAALLFLIGSAPLNAEQDDLPLYPGFPSIEESEAFRVLMSRPLTDLSILHYLIDRYENSEVKIRYDQHSVNAKIAGRVAHLFLITRYRGETPKQWILRWCHQTIIQGNIIWVELPNGDFRMSKDVLLGEFEALQRILALQASN